MAIMKLYHGSPVIVEKPDFAKARPHNDYGPGFYCTDDLELAKEWACSEDHDGFANEYRIDLSGLQTLDLSDEGYSILNWLAILLEHRVVRLSTPNMKRARDWLLANYAIDVTSYDVVSGYRADDSYFGFARAFLNNGITLGQLEVALKLGNLGMQTVLVSPPAFERIEFQRAHVAEHAFYHVKRMARNQEAIEQYNALLEREDRGGVLMRDLMDGRAGV